MLTRESAATRRRLRGVILENIQINHERQRTRFADVSLMDVLDDLSYKVYLDLVRELLQDLESRGLVTFKEHKHPRTGESMISEIEITARGKDLLEGKYKDPSVNVLIE